MKLRSPSVDLIVYDRRSKIISAHPLPSKGTTHPWRRRCVKTRIEFLIPKDHSEMRATVINQSGGEKCSRRTSQALRFWKRIALAYQSKSSRVRRAISSWTRQHAEGGLSSTSEETNSKQTASFSRPSKGRFQIIIDSKDQRFEGQRNRAGMRGCSYQRSSGSFASKFSKPKRMR